MSPETTTPATLNDILAALRDLGDRLTVPPTELLTRESFAALLDIGTSTFDKLREAGKIGPRAFKMAGWKWHRAEVLAWLTRRDTAGELFDAAAWPAVWEVIQRKNGDGKSTGRCSSHRD